MAKKRNVNVKQHQRKVPSGGKTTVKQHTRKIKDAKNRIKINKLKRKILMGDIQEEKAYIQWLNGDITEEEYSRLKEETQNKYKCLDEENFIYAFSVDTLEDDLKRVEDIKKNTIQWHGEFAIKSSQIYDQKEIIVKPNKSNL